MLINFKKKKVQVIAQPASTSAAATEITQAIQAENADLASTSSFVGHQSPGINATATVSQIPLTKPVKVVTKVLASNPATFNNRATSKERVHRTAPANLGCDR